MNRPEAIRAIVKGDVRSDDATRKTFSRDTSLFEVKPAVIVSPKDAEDVKRLVSYVSERKEDEPALSITARAGGSDMTGGPLNESIILDVTAHMNARSVDAVSRTAVVQPGVFFRDLEPLLNAHNLMLPPFPASKGLAALGGMIMNNCAGEKTLRYGQMRKWVNEVTMVLADGNERTFKKISMAELAEKKKQRDFEGLIYTKMHDMLESKYDLIKAAKPKTSKNSCGYALWDIYDREAGTFDLSQLFVGSQGTLGMMTQAVVRLEPIKKHERLVALFFPSWVALPDVVNALLPLSPECMEAFDDATITLGIRFMPDVAKKAGESFFRFASRFIPEALIGIRMMRMPKLIVLVQFAEDDEKEANRKAQEAVEIVKREKFKCIARISPSKADADKYWTMRRESFNLLRSKVKGKRTAPFVEDFCVPPTRIPEFLPKAITLLDEHDIRANITGHAGNGNYHIIPLMDLSDPRERDKIADVAVKFNALVIAHGGTITAEHNDGILRTPFVESMYGKEVYDLFEQTKDILDPLGIFNPGKKVGGTLEFLKDHVVSS
jgi:FAD/FMN-containing dehydrogenase